MIRPILILAAVAAAVPASAQVGQGAVRERYVQLREGERCPRSDNPEEVIVCGTVRENDRYRIPERFREPSAADAQSAEGRVEDAQLAGDTGIGSCSGVGLGGFTGCYGQDLANWRAQRRRERAARDQAVED